MPNVLHLIDTTGPGGAETVFSELAVRVQDHGYRSSVILTGRGWLSDHLEARGLSPVIVPSGNTSLDLRYLRAMIDLARRERIDVIHAHLLGANTYASLVGRLTRKQVVATFHGSVDIDPADAKLRTKLRLISWGAGAIIFVSDRLKSDFIARTRLNPSKCHRIYNGIDLSAYGGLPDPTLRQELGLGTEDVLIGALGNIRPAKGYNVLLDAAASLKGAHPNLKFAIAGQPDRHGLYDQLQERRNVLGLQETLHFVGHRSDPSAFLKGLDIFVLPSISEGLSISTIEAMAAGVPVVATRCGGPEEFICHNDNGILVPPSNPQSLAQALANLGNAIGCRRRLSKKALQTAGGLFRIDAMINQYVSLYDSLLAINGHAHSA